MLKLSFIDSPDSKAVKVSHPSDIVTVVTITGRVKVFMEDVWIPTKVTRWALQYYGLTITDEGGYLEITSSGKTVRRRNDVDNPVVAYRIAEAKAKIKLYRFMYHLCYKLVKKYSMLLTGIPEASVGASNSLVADVTNYELLLLREQKHLKELIEAS